MYLEMEFSTNNPWLGIFHQLSFVSFLPNKMEFFHGNTKNRWSLFATIFFGVTPRDDNDDDGAQVGFAAEIALSRLSMAWTYQ